MEPSIEIVLVQPSHPGNIGATARAMKTMGLTQLVLVQPQKFPDPNATAMAAGADDILATARIVDQFQQAIGQSQLVLATSARTRRLQLPLLTPKKAANLILAQAPHHRISIVFGRENNGLSNEELEHCTHQIYVPTNPVFGSLNLAATVQIISYEINMAKLYNSSPAITPDPDLATTEERNFLQQRLRHTLATVNFFHHHQDKEIMSKLNLILKRAQLTRKEIKLLQGIISAIDTTVNLKPPI